MPIYEYKCKDCGSHFEKRQSVSDAPLKVCENCQGELEKQWSLSGFSFKGDGWYVTDYSKKGAKPETSTAEKTSASESTTSSDAASKSKSEAPSKTD